MALAQMGVFCALCIGCHQLDINGGITQAKSLFRLNVQKKILAMAQCARH
jgi:hypothetical protein